MHAIVSHDALLSGGCAAHELVSVTWVPDGCKLGGAEQQAGMLKYFAEVLQMFHRLLSLWNTVRCLQLNI